MSSITPKPKVLAAHLISLMILSLFTISPVTAQEHMANFGTNNFELSMEMIPTTDGNYVTVSPIMNFNVTNAGLGIKIYLSKVDENSNVIWSRKIGQFPSVNQFPISVTEVVDDAGGPIGYAITGINIQAATPDPIFVITTDTNGHVLATRTYGGNLPVAGANLTPVAGVGNKIIQDHQGNLVVVGSLRFAGNVGVVPFILNTQTNLNLNYMRLYHDVRYLTNGFGIGSMAGFDDIVAIPAMEDPQTGEFVPDGYLITGGTRQVGAPGSAETLVVRTDPGGHVLKSGIYGPTFADSKGRGIELASNGLVKVVSHVKEATGAPLSTQIFTLTPASLILLQQDRYHGFISHGDIRETNNGEFILAGRGAFDRDGAVLRVEPNGNIVFFYGYGSNHVEILTDVHELYDGTLYASGVTTTWCQGPADEYLVRTKNDGTLPGCPVLSLNIDRSTPQEPMRDTDWESVNVTLVNAHEIVDVTPDTVKRQICPGLVPVPFPWDWFRRGDFTRDQEINVADAIGSLSKLFSSGPESVPANAADANADGNHDIGDVIYTLSYLFSGGAAPAAPFTEVGPDPEQDQPNIFSVEEFFQYYNQNFRMDEAGFHLNFDLEI